MWKFLLAASGLVLMLACQPVPPTDHSHDDGSHSHGTADAHEHAEEASLSYTRWTDQAELFVEFKPLVVGEVSSFAAHFTRLSDYRPIGEGTVTASLIVGDKGIKQSVSGPSSPGIFTPALRPTTPGKGRLIFDLASPDFSEQIILEDIPVYATAEEALAATPEEDAPGGAIDFLKEQAWKIDFQVMPVRLGRLQEVIPTTGEILPMQGDEQAVAAPSSGIVVFTNTKMLPGRAVRQGEWLFTLIATGDPEDNLEARLQQAKATLKKAEAEYARRSDLLKAQAIAQKDFEETELQYNLAKVALANLTQYLAEGGRKVFASKNGYIKDVYVEPGDFVETGTSVLTITQNRKLQLVADLPQQYFTQLREIRNADFRTLYHEELQSITQYNGKLVSYAQSISSREPFIPLYFELDNMGGLLPGSYVELFLHTGKTKESLAVPRTALIEEFGNYYVMVQLTGERFEKRLVKVGIDNGNMVEISHGLQQGEMVVTRGAYQVKMASMASAIPAHGHTH